ncbi:hypothetical protein Moror_14029 [Moniliophthora roreri MCA 2997]|uniref:Transmembrane protein n=2 Tax=Moniliophthora roreri TaxID=221103 RepID=V2YTL6_MONRO|nr:hypothetical protein Moror_14029 [Moniliophthora roreri MCA 2997]KAI3607420.1 hypothetical protein WG66_004957 [Moniliophthora roreri]
MSVTYFVDDRDTSIEYLCPVERELVRDSYLRNTYTTIRGGECGGGWFRYAFKGTSVNIFNHAKTGNNAVSVQLDISPLFKLTTILDGSYQSPMLQDGEHTVTFAFGNESLFPAFDFLTVTAGDSTQLKNKTIIVDDTDPGIRYSGNWRTQPSTPDASLTFDYSAKPYLNTTRWSNTVGDSITFTFEGTSVAVYGVIPGSNKTSQNMTATYTIDSRETLWFSFPMSSGSGRPIPMRELLRVDSLAEGKHTIDIDITSVPDASAAGLGFDFILYNASYTSLATMDTSIPTVSGSSSHRTRSGAWRPIVGGVVGLVVLLGLCVAWLLWRKKQKAKVKAKSEAKSKVFVLPTLNHRQSFEHDEKTKAGSLTHDL